MNARRTLDYFTALGAAVEEGRWSTRLGGQNSQIAERCRDHDTQLLGVDMILQGDASPGTPRQASVWRSDAITTTPLSKRGPIAGRCCASRRRRAAHGTPRLRAEWSIGKRVEGVRSMARRIPLAANFRASRRLMAQTSCSYKRKLVCGPCGVSIPKYAKASRVPTRPLGVRSRKPSCIR